MSEYVFLESFVSPHSAPDLIELTTETVCAYVSKNSLPAAELPVFMKSVHDALHAIGNDSSSAETKPAKLMPAVSIKKSITEDYIVCLEDGQQFKSLKRHLMSKYGLTPDAYRAKWELASDYPMVAPAYAKARSTMALSLGFGRKLAVQPPAPAKAAAKTVKAGATIAEAVPPVAASTVKTARRGRPAKAA